MVNTPEERGEGTVVQFSNLQTFKAPPLPACERGGWAPEANQSARRSTQPQPYHSTAPLMVTRWARGARRERHLPLPNDHRPATRTQLSKEASGGARTDNCTTDAQQYAPRSRGWRWRRRNYNISNFSRFFRDNAVWDFVVDTVLYQAAAAAAKQNQGTIRDVRVWSVGCATGEEAYSVRMAWQLHIATQVDACPKLQVTATDRSEAAVQLAAAGVYPEVSLRECSDEVKAKCFERVEQSDDERGTVIATRNPNTAEAAGATCLYRIKQKYREGVTFEQQDLFDVTSRFDDVSSTADTRSAGKETMCDESPAQLYDVILCRYALFLYLPADLREKALEHLVRHLRPGGYLVLGRKGTETLPKCNAAKFLRESLSTAPREGNVFRRISNDNEGGGGDDGDGNTVGATLSHYIRRKQAAVLQRDMELLRRGLARGRNDENDERVPYTPLSWCLRLHGGQRVDVDRPLSEAPRAWITLSDTLRRVREERLAAESAERDARRAKESALARQKRAMDKACMQRRVASARARSGAPAAGGGDALLRRFALFDAERGARNAAREEAEERRVRALLGGKTTSKMSSRRRSLSAAAGRPTRG